MGDSDIRGADDEAATSLALGVSSVAEVRTATMAPPPWQDPPASLAMDIGFHQVYGLGAALAFRVLNRTAFS